MTSAARQSPRTPAAEDGRRGCRGSRRPSTEADEPRRGRGCACGGDAGARAAREPAPKAGATRREKLEAKRAERRVEAGSARRARPRSATPTRSPSASARPPSAAATAPASRPSRPSSARAEPRAGARPRPEHGPGRAEGAPGRRRVRQGARRRSSCASTWSAATGATSKIMRSSPTLHAHDERNDAHPGDTVRVQSSAARCRAPSAGAWSRSWSGPSDPERDPPARGRQHRRARDPHASA